MFVYLNLSKYFTVYSCGIQSVSVMSVDLRFNFAIDRGGTFTDIYCEVYKGNELHDTVVSKLLSEDPLNYKDAPTEGIRRILERVTGSPHPRAEKVSTANIDHIRMGTTVATNALLERKGERCALLTTKGFKDLQVIGNQSRPKIFDLEIRRPDLLYEYVAEIDERVVLLKDSEPEYNSAFLNKPERVVTGVGHEQLYVVRPIDEEAVRVELLRIQAMGIDSLAVCLAHSYTFSAHEQVVKRVAQELGFGQISCSSEVMPMVRMVPRGCTTCVDAYLTPVIRRYLDSFCSGFDSQMQQRVQISFMQSDGGLTPMKSFLGNHAILSGPAGGVVGYARTSYSTTEPGITPQPVIGFDMGGTSTDVSRFDGVYEHVFESTTAGVTIQSPQLDINTVAAGGGSRLFYRNGLFVVGPESAGAHPGPVCYRKTGGLLAITDANVFLGRIQPHLFPAIFGESESEPLDYEAARVAFEEVTERINHDIQDQNKQRLSGAGSIAAKLYTVDEVAYGFIRIANEAMARPIRNLTTMKGYDVTRHALSCFGGAGPQHCCAIAKSLGMKKIYVHRHSGILSAYGLSLADIVVERQVPYSGALNIDSMPVLTAELGKLRESAHAELKSQGFVDTDMMFTGFLNCRYEGTDTALMTSVDGEDAWLPYSVPDTITAQYKSAFVSNYQREFGFELSGRRVLVDDIRVRAVGRTATAGSHSVERDTTNEIVKDAVESAEPSETVSVYFEGGRRATNVYFLNQLRPQTSIVGPAIIVQNVATVVVEPGCVALITRHGDIEICVQEVLDKSVTVELDPIYLSIFSHRFMGIAEQMGRTLQRTSISVNIKERLDFSCALFDPQGGLVANAPHLPVHLGAMSDAVRHQVTYWGLDNLAEGDVLVSNHPQLAGGSHLPDITVITPIFRDGEIVFFVASRGHHADVGGISPGSMPPMSKTLVDEGAAIIAFKLVNRGEFQEEGMAALLRAPGEVPGNSGTRNLSDNISDLKAQVAANHRGAALMQELVEEYSLGVVQAYMGHIQVCAEQAVRAMLRDFSIERGLGEVGSVSAEDFLDDGTPIRLKVTIDRSGADGPTNTTSATFDFTGTGPEMYGNLNAPPAVTASAVIYCLRCLLKTSDIPLNQGCLAPVNIIIPKNSVLNPSANAAVVGGNVLTSQRVTDVVLLAFEACAASQGCMNNLTFGDASMGYYETIAGGAGAGASWNGCSGVHTHMVSVYLFIDILMNHCHHCFVLRNSTLFSHCYRQTRASPTLRL